jgi:hypothetical protein
LSSSKSKTTVLTVAAAAVLAFLIVQLNIYFAWTSHFGIRPFHRSPIRLLVVNEVDFITRIQLAIPGVSSFFTNLAKSSRYDNPENMLEIKLFIDCEVIVFTLAVFLITMFLFRSKGIGVSLLRAFEITSAAILPLGFEIYFYDRGQFNIHASDIQVKLGLGWFTNADALYLTSGILGIALLIEFFRQVKKIETAEARNDLLYPQSAR